MYDTCGSACPPTCDNLSPECTKECNAGIDQCSHMRMACIRKVHLCKRNTSPLLDEILKNRNKKFLAYTKELVVAAASYIIFCWNIPDCLKVGFFSQNRLFLP